MTLQQQQTFTIPEETARVARAAYPHGNTIIKMRDVLGTIYHDEAFAHLFPHNGRPVEAPWRLTLITIMQFMEELSDREAADAVRGRIDWKYALGLELTDPGFDATVLCEFRKRLVEGGAEQLLLDAMLTLFKERGWLKEGQRQRTDSTHVLAKVRAINRLLCVGEAMRFALNSLADAAPDWLLAHCEEEWLYRYGHRIEEGRLPKSQAKRQEVAEVIGRDGSSLLTELFDPASPTWLSKLPAVELLRQIWVQNYYWQDDELHWRDQNNIPPASIFINSPYDPEARLGKKRSTLWTGYKVHLSETCEEKLPHLITHVATTPAPKTDEAMVDAIHEDLQQSEVLPGVHLLDAGYVTSRTLTSSKERFGVEVIGPPPANQQWQAHNDQDFDVTRFAIDWDQQQVTCPQGHTSRSWTPFVDNRQHPLIKVHFSTTHCRNCPVQDHCIHSQSKYKRRTLTLRPQAQHEALQQARLQQDSPATISQYHVREGVEATISQGVRAFGMRRSRYVGQDNPIPTEYPAGINCTSQRHS
jgi:transposase